MKKNYMNWSWIIFFLIIFWPLGLILAIKKLLSEKLSFMCRKTGVLSFIGWVSALFGGIIFIITVSNSLNTFGIFISLLFLLGDILLLIKVSNTTKAVIKYKKYIDIIMNQNIRNIDNIASVIGLSYNTTSKYLQRMINTGYLKDAYIHQGNREIILKQCEFTKYTHELSIHQTPSQTFTSRCHYCGTNNLVVIGKTVECKCCGTNINV